MQQLIRHPSYPGHLLSYFQYKNGFTCNGCGEDGHGKGYRCDFCNLDLHRSCGTLNMAEERVIQHPTHPGHCLSYVRYPHAFVCDGCREYVLGKGYRCTACDFDLHISCATVNIAEKRVIQHPSHPGHWLSYVRYPRSYTCDGCGEDLHGNGYNCAACEFDLHECCATAPPVLHHSLHDGNGKWVQFQMEPPGGSQMRCSECAGSVSGFGYYCTSSSCEYALHPTCALLPRRHTQVDRAPPQPGDRQIIRHWSHPEHCLNYVRYPHGLFYCSGCGEDVNGNGYSCATCDFDLHECCATVPPVLHHSFHGGNGEWVQFRKVAPSGSQMRCSDCGRRMLGFGYYCTSNSCWYALHPTCASLPRRHTQVETAPPQPDKGDGRRRKNKGRHKFLVNLPIGSSTSIGGAFADLALSD